MLVLVISYIFILSGYYGFENVVVPNCDISKTICEYNWTINYIQTMVHNPLSGTGTRFPIVPENGTLLARTDCGSREFYKSVKDNYNFITGDGVSRMMFAINGQIPGPSITVYEGQEILVRVKNGLWMEGVTIHWHGLPQKGTPFMDGVPGVTQCPINPGETFTYRFKAEPHGTFWYHSHLGTERSDGLAGSLIILDRPSAKESPEKHASEFIVLLYDWFPIGATTAAKWAAWDINRYSDDFHGDRCYDVKRTYDYAEVGQRGRQTPAINAKGRPYNKDGTTEYPFLPLEIFVVIPGHSYRLRIISIVAMNAYRLSIDNHTLKILAVDGSDVEAETAESVILHSAERFDVEIQTEAPVGNYWVRLEDMASKDTNEKPLSSVRGYGILRYEGAPLEEPSSRKTECTKDAPCRIINCLFGKFPDHLNTYCVPISSLKSTESELKRLPVPMSAFQEDYQEYFLNFHFTNVKGNPKARSSINGIRMNLPASPLLIDPNSPSTATSCDQFDCTIVCTCTHVIDVQLGKVAQFVFINYEPTGFGRAHPVHMHGHQFHVLKTGFPEYDRVTGNMTRMNSDILCNTRECNVAKWSNDSWRYGNVPGINELNPALKDTVIVPWGGYVVVRMMADNPGFWYLHCHIELHNVDGMALVLKEGKRTDMPKLPSGIRRCGDFDMAMEDKGLFSQKKSLSETLSASLNKQCSIKSHCVPSKTYVTILIVFLCLSMLTNIVLSTILYSKIQSDDAMNTRENMNANNNDEKKYLLS